MIIQTLVFSESGWIGILFVSVLTVISGEVEDMEGFFLNSAFTSLLVVSFVFPLVKSSFPVGLGFSFAISCLLVVDFSAGTGTGSLAFVAGLRLDGPATG